MIRYRKEGGFAGVMEELQIEDDGTAHYQRSISGTPQHNIKERLESDTLRELAKLVERADTPSLRGGPKEKRPVFDAFTYQVTYGRKHREKTVEVQSIEEAPVELRPLLSHLERVIKNLLAK